jgi:hypothetical protein
MCKLEKRSESATTKLVKCKPVWVNRAEVRVKSLFLTIISFSIRTLVLPLV